MVTEFEYMLPLCSVNALGVTTISSLKPCGGGKLVRALGKLGEAAVERVVASAVAMQQIHDRIAAGRDRPA